MRIVSVRFKNLNSLSGEWFIDFTDPAYVDSGIFAITGPTGAGKTTLLDAICLALYGRTPRLRVVSQSLNDIMSRRTGECFAEIDIETAKGRYRCHWSQHRAGRKADGKLQGIRHELTDLHTNTPIATKQKEVEAQVEFVTGMDFDRFTRSILLAQGSFAAFLQASASERSPILEQITGTGIYSDLSIHVHTRTRDERSRLDSLKAELSGIVCLPADQLDGLRARLDQLRHDAKTAEHTIDHLRQAQNWLARIKEVTEQAQQHANQLAMVEQEWADFQPNRDKLALADQAAAIDSLYDQWQAAEKSLRDSLARHQKAAEALPALHQRRQSLQDSLAAAKDALQVAQEKRDTERPRLHTVRTLDTMIHGLETEIQQNRERHAADSRILAEVEEGIRDTETRRRMAEKDRAEANLYAQQHARDAELVSDLNTIRDQMAALNKTAQSIAERQRAITAYQDKARQHEQDLAQSREKHRRLEDSQSRAKQTRDQCENSLKTVLNGRTLAMYQDDLAQLLQEKAKLDRIASLEQQRAALQAGEACPLCGSVDHPFAHGAVPSPLPIEQDITDVRAIIQRAGQAEDAVTASRQAESAAVMACLTALADVDKGQSVVLGDQNTIAELTADLTRQQEDHHSSRSALQDRLVRLGVDWANGDSASDVLERLEQRQAAWIAQTERKIEAEKQHAQHGATLDRLAQEQNRLTETLRQTQDRYQDLTVKMQALQKERHALYGDQNPDHVELALQKDCEDAQSDVTIQQDQNAQHAKALVAAEQTLRTLDETIQTQRDDVARLEQAVADLCREKSFDNVSAYRAVRLDDAHRQSLRAMVQDLETRKAALQSQLAETRAVLQAETAKAITDQSAEDVQIQLETRTSQLVEMQKETGGLEKTLLDNEAAERLYRDKQAKIDAQTRDYQRWATLDSVIGSANGSKFRDFAQGLTFEIMIAHANQTLQKMSDRYCLIRDLEQPLEVRVLDNYQGGEIRSTKNLSGGESFIVSLALALGLSSMSSRTIRVDSLFLDEGFGTLDEETLETALQTLSSLHQDGKLIGVISHMPALKDRIPTQIRVTPLNGGKSRLTGPGCHNS